jgi:ComF family protein
MAPSAVARWLDPLLDLVFPALCPVCQIRSDDARHRPFCAACWRALPLLSGPVCRVCGAPFAGLGADERCPACRRGAPPVAFLRAVAAYRDGMRAAIHAFKYQRRAVLAAPLGRLLADAGEPLLPAAFVDAVVPVPLHPLRLAERGFNQAELLARPCAARWGVPLRPRALGRARPTRPQAELDAAARRANVAGAFIVERPAETRGQRLLLVDDVLTTGATVQAAAEALLRSGATAVGVLVLARVEV